MALPLKTWHDEPSELTPIDAESLNDLESRVGAYTDTQITTVGTAAAAAAASAATALAAAEGAVATIAKTISPFYRGITEFGVIGTADDTAVFKSACEACAKEEKVLLLPKNAVITIRSYVHEALVEGVETGNLKVYAPFGATLKHKAGTTLPMVSSKLGAPQKANISFEGIIFEGNSYDARTKVVEWNEAKKELKLESTAGFAAPGGGGAGENPIHVGATVYFPKEAMIEGVIPSHPYCSFNYSAISGNTLTGVQELGGEKISALIKGEQLQCDQQGEKEGLRLSNFENVSITRCTFKKFMGRGAGLINTRILRFERNRVEECTTPYQQNAVDVINYEPAGTEYGEIWLKDNLCFNNEQAAIVVTCNPKTGYMGGNEEKSNIRIVGNIIFNSKFWAGIDCEAGYIEDVLIEGNQVFGCQQNIGLSHGNEPSSTTVAETKTLANGESLKIQAAGIWYKNKGELKLKNTNGEIKYLSYEEYSSTTHEFKNVKLNGASFAITSASTVVEISGDSEERAIIRGNIVDGLNNWDKTITGIVNGDIAASGSYITIEGNQIRSTVGRNGNKGGQSIALLTSNKGGVGKGNKIINNTIVMAPTGQTESERRPASILFKNQVDLEVSGNTTTREKAREETLGEAGVSIVGEVSSSFSVKDNSIFEAGTAGIRMVACKYFDIEGNKGRSPGRTANSVGFIELENSCFDVTITGNKCRYDGIGLQYEYGVNIKNGGGQKIRIKDNDFTGYKSIMINDQQNIEAAKVKTTAAVVAGENLEFEGSATSYPANGGRCVINGTQQIYEAVKGTLLIGLRPGGSFTAGQAIQIVKNSVTIQFNNIGEKSPWLATVNAQPLMLGLNGRKETYGSAAPTEGTWSVGDICWNTAPGAGGTPFWICVTGGTPGTWQKLTLA